MNFGYTVLDHGAGDSPKVIAHLNEAYMVRVLLNGLWADARNLIDFTVVNNTTRTRMDGWTWNMRQVGV